MGRPKKAIPSYLLHKPTGQARVRVNGREIYLGRYGSTESKEAYARIVAECAAGTELKSIDVPIGQPFTVSSLLVKYDDHVRQFYVSQGKTTEEIYRTLELHSLPRMPFALPIAALLELLGAQARNRSSVLSLAAVIIFYRTRRNERWFSLQARSLRAQSG